MPPSGPHGPADRCQGSKPGARTQRAGRIADSWRK
jgi:hypothetical protein